MNTIETLNGLSPNRVHTTPFALSTKSELRGRGGALSACTDRRSGAFRRTSRSPSPESDSGSSTIRADGRGFFSRRPPSPVRDARHREEWPSTHDQDGADTVHALRRSKSTRRLSRLADEPASKVDSTLTSAQRVAQLAREQWAKSEMTPAPAAPKPLSKTLSPPAAQAFWQGLPEPHLVVEHDFAFGKRLREEEDPVRTRSSVCHRRGSVKVREATR